MTNSAFLTELHTVSSKLHYYMRNPCIRAYLLQHITNISLTDAHFFLFVLVERLLLSVQPM